jgi:phenylalanyl-tRNA synthetase beta chain
LLPGLLQNACLNFQRQMEGVRLFETGRVFFENSSGKQEVQRLGILLAGQTTAAHWQAKPQNADFYEMTGTLEALAQRLGITRFQWAALRHAAFHPRRAAVLMNGKTILAWVGEIHPDLLDKLDRREPFIAAELDIESWHAAMPRTTISGPIPAYPPIHRDLSVIAPLTMPYEKLSRTLRTAAGNLLESETLMDVYQGEKIGTDKKSLTFSLVFRHADRTLNDVEIEKTMAKILTELQQHCETVIRS